MLFFMLITDTVIALPMVIFAKTATAINNCCNNQLHETERLTAIKIKKMKKEA